MSRIIKEAQVKGNRIVNTRCNYCNKIILSEEDTDVHYYGECRKDDNKCNCGNDSMFTCRITQVKYCYDCFEKHQDHCNSCHPYLRRLIHIIDDTFESCEDFNRDIDDYIINDSNWKLEFQDLCEKCVIREAQQ